MRVRSLVALAALALPAFSRAQPTSAPHVRTLEERVSRLRGKLAPPSAHLRDLRGKLDAELAARTRAVLLHREELGGGYALEAASYTIDEAASAGSRAAARIARGRAEVVLERALAAGAHRVSAALVYRVDAGPDAPPRRLELRTSYPFEAHPGATTRVTVVTHERAGAAPGEERVAVRFELEESPAEGAPAERADRP